MESVEQKRERGEREKDGREKQEGRGEHRREREK